jgi:hypothetical protein
MLVVVKQEDLVVDNKERELMNLVVSKLDLRLGCMGLELDLALGNISTEQYDRAIDSYLPDHVIPDVNELAEKIEMFFKITNYDLGSFLLGYIFNCDHEYIAKAIAIIDEKYKNMEESDV